MSIISINGYHILLINIMVTLKALHSFCRYFREESFTCLNIEISNMANIQESLEQYVKCDLLEGANAYHCEKCNKKVGVITIRIIAMIICKNNIKATSY